MAFKDVNVGGGVDSLEEGKGTRGSYICTQGIEERKPCIALSSWRGRRHVLGHGSIESIWLGGMALCLKYSGKVNVQPGGDPQTTGLSLSMLKTKEDKIPN
jgi:hypothetical protein